MKPHPRPTHKNAHALSLGDENKQLHKVWQVCCEKEKRENKNKGAFDALSIVKAQGKELCYQRRYGNQKKGDTRHNTQKQPTHPRKAGTHSLSTGGQKRGGTNRELCMVAFRIPRISATHLQGLFYRFSSSAFGQADRRQEPTKV